MSDLAEKLRDYAKRTIFLSARPILTEAADQIDRLNKEVSVLIAECQAMKDRLVNGDSLTDAERFTLRGVRDTYADEDDAECNEIAAVIDGLLERLGGKR